MQRGISSILWIAGIAASVVTIWYVCAFYIIDLDVWWHIAAGREMVQNGWISTDPFAYVRVGEPYLATQSWLAQIILSFVYDGFGATGMIAFRTLLMIGVVVPIFLIKPKQMWSLAPLATYAVLAMRPAILDRPQLFSFVIFSVCLWLALQWMDNRITTKRYLITAFTLQVLWVNLHGGAALLHLGIVGAVFLQERDKDALTAGGLLILALFVSPNFLHTFSYVSNLFSDQTVGFIREWEPRPLANYLRWILPCWIAGGTSILYFRRHLIFSVVIFLVFGYLSTKALRHEPFFITVAMMLTVYQVVIPSKLEKEKWMVSIMIVGALLMAWIGHQDKYLATGRLGQNGYGAYEPLRGAYDFVETQGIEGNMFNTYEGGMYLLFRGAPVFVDGRNVDYGFEFLNEFFAAGSDPIKFQSLDRTYNFSHAVIQFEYFQGLSPLPFVSLLEGFHNWSLVYIDDAGAVYIRDDGTSGYTQLEPKFVLEPTRILSEVSEDSYPTLERELIHAIEQSPDAVRLLLSQAALYVAGGLYSDAEDVLKIVEARAPNNSQIYNLFALLRVNQSRYAEAGAFFEKAIRVGGGSRGASMNYEDLAWVFQQAGDTKKANYYLRKAQK